MIRHLFSYGTLLPGLAPPSVATFVDRMQPVGPASIKGVLYDLGAYAGALIRPGKDRVVGHIYELPQDPAVLAALDTYEEFDPKNPDGSEFVRVETPAELASGQPLTCWIYLYNRDVTGVPQIPDGDFAKLKR